jgi:L-lactate dehydrogenase complex protein LldG
VDASALFYWLGLQQGLSTLCRKNIRESFLESDSLLSGTGDKNIIQIKNTQEQAPALQNKIEQFTNELTALSGHVTLTKNPTQSIIEFLNARGINKIHLEPNTLNESLLREANIEFTDTPDDKILVGVTNAICGLADTGSVLEADGALHASLLPEIHIAVLKSSNILPSLSDAMKFVKDKSAAVFITGPSRTADIEMTLTIGVHGPKEIHVFVDDSNSG